MEGIANKWCPYFHSRRIKDIADVLLMPYNYLLQPSTTPAFRIELSNCIIIFDEAHNILNTAEEGASINISITMLQEVIKLKKYRYKNCKFILLLSKYVG